LKDFVIGNDGWDKGKIYDPNSEIHLTPVIQLTDLNTAIVRAIGNLNVGKSMVFKEIVKISPVASIQHI